MPNINITRSNEYTNRVRNINLLIDGQKMTTISNNETKTLELPAGVHTIQAKIDWCTSNVLTFAVKEGETKSFYFDSFAKHSSWGTLAAIYYITVGAGKYLRLKEV